MHNIITVSHLRKQYRQALAVKDISFEVEEGKLLAFLGPNGAGKSTTIQILCTLLAFDSGTVTVNDRLLGKEDRQIRSEIGVVFQENMLDDLLTVKENLKIRAGFYFRRGTEVRQAVERVTTRLGLEDVMGRPYGKLSGGQRRRADIARALLHTPKILFLDEPTTGLDPQTRRSVWETVRTLQTEEQMTVFLTTHYMEEAAEADQVVVIDDGLVAARGTPAGLKEQFAHDLLKLTVKSQDNAQKILRHTGVSWYTQGGQLVVPLTSSRQALPLLCLLEEEIITFEMLQGTMDDVFMAITGKEMKE